MKSIGTGIVTVILWVAIATVGSPQVLAQQAHDYWVLGVSADEMTIHYIDAKSIVSVNGSLKRAWTTSFNSSSAHVLSGLHFTVLQEVNCQTRQAHSVQLTAYNSRGGYESALSQDGPNPWTYAVPGTITEVVMEFICLKETANTFIAVPLPQDVTPEEHAKKMFEWLNSESARHQAKGELLWVWREPGAVQSQPIPFRGGPRDGFWRQVVNRFASYDRALAIKPDHAEAFNNRGLALQDLDRVDDCIPFIYRQGLELL